MSDICGNKRWFWVTIISTDTCGNPILDTRISVCPAWRSWYPHWIQKPGELESCGWTLISLNGKTKRISLFFFRFFIFFLRFFSCNSLELNFAKGLIIKKKKLIWASSTKFCLFVICLCFSYNPNMGCTFHSTRYTRSAVISIDQRLNILIVLQIIFVW